MSGPIQKLIGPAKSHVQRTIEEAEALLDTVPDEMEVKGDEMTYKPIVKSCFNAGKGLDSRLE